MRIHQLKPPKGARKKKKMKGRGPSSGHGKTSTRGSKGQKSRTGKKNWLGFEGGQTPLIRRFPKRGFRSFRKKEFQIVNLEKLERFPESSKITPQILEEEGLIRDRDKAVKILGKGKIDKSFEVSAHSFSKKAIELIKQAGGEVRKLGKLGS